MTVTQVIPQLRTTNIEESIDFYTTRAGFELEFRYEDFYAGIKAGDQLFHLKLVDEKDPSIAFVDAGGHVHLYFMTDDVEATARELKINGVAIGQIENTPWQMKQFYARDNEGHTLCFGQST